MKTILYTLFLFAFLIINGQGQEDRIKSVESNLHFQTFTETDISTLGRSIYEKLKAYKIPGASVAVINDGKIDWTKTYGVLDANTDEQINENSLFQCASIGKVITAMAVLNLVEEGYISLDEPVNNKLKRWKFANNENTLKVPVTLRHLLSHSSGLTDEYGFLGYSPNAQIPTLLNILNNEAPASGKKSLEIRTVPGTVERYSGAGYVIIQLLIEDLTGNSFQGYVEKTVFNPLGMKNTTYANSPDIDLGKEVAQGHIKNGNAIKERKYNIYPEKAAAGPWTTAIDLALLIIEIQNAFHGTSDLILNQSSAQEMLSFQINNKGLALNLKGFKNTLAFWHAGQNLGFTAVMYGTLDSKSGAVILLNSDQGEKLMQEFMTSVANAYNWPVMRSFKTENIPGDDMDKMVGSYYSKLLDNRLFIREKKGEIYISKKEKGKGYLLNKIGENHYSIRRAQDYIKISFHNDFLSIKYSEGLGKEIDLHKEDG